MNNRRAQLVQSMLDQYVGAPEIPLQHTDPYTLLIAVLLSAQCTDKRVNQITPKLFQLAATPQAMAALSIETIQEIIRPCGLSPAKSKAIHGLSVILCEKYGGRVPDTAEALEALPGVGHKTAAVVLSQVFGQETFPVDTHIFRLARRWGLSAGHTRERVERDLKQLFPPASWRTLHLQMITYGRTYCPARGCAPCPICAKLK